MCGEDAGEADPALCGPAWKRYFLERPNLSTGRALLPGWVFQAVSSDSRLRWGSV